LEADFERAHWEKADSSTKQSLRSIKEFIDYLEITKRELVLASTRLSTEEAVHYIGPGAEVALTGITHAIDYLAVCRNMIQDNDLVVTTRALARLNGSQ
jgi:hypothetical protein